MTRSAQRLVRVVALRNQYLLAIGSLPIGAVIPADQKAWRWQVLFSVCLSPLLLCISVELCLVKILGPVGPGEVPRPRRERRESPRLLAGATDPAAGGRPRPVRVAASERGTEQGGDAVVALPVEPGPPGGDLDAAGRRQRERRGLRRRLAPG